MSESTLETLLTGRGRRWFGIAWGLVLTAVAVLPGVDLSIERYHELGKLRAELGSRAALPDRARKLAERVAQLHRETADLEATLVSADALSSFKQDVTRMARAAKCRLLSIRPGSASRRPLDEVLGGPGGGTKRPAKKPEWEVEEQISLVSIQGSFANLVEFLSRLDNDIRLLQLASLDLHPPPNRSDELILDLHIKTFNLFRSRPG